MASPSSGVELVSCDGVTYEVNLDVARVFRTLEAMMESKWHILYAKGMTVRVLV